MYQNLDERSIVIENEKRVFPSWVYRIMTVSAVVSLVLFVSLAVSSNITDKNLTSVSKITRITTLKAIPTDTSYSELSDNEKRYLYDLFLKEFKDTVPEDQYDERFSVFLKNLADIDSRNGQETGDNHVFGQAIHGITKFSAYTDEEKAMIKIKLPRSELKNNEIPVATISKYTGDKTNVDWTGVLTTPVKSQGLCGSCWAFSVASQVESDAIRANILTIDDSLSAQQILSCEHADDQCDGGFTENGFAYAKDHGLALAADYDYVSDEGTAPECNNDFKPVVKVTSFSTIDSEESMIDYVLSTGPLSVCIDSTTWYSYVGGVLTSCPSENIDHCVQIVGVNKEEGYWIIRNTWGTDWGENGNLRIATGSNQCGITTDPIFTSVAIMKSGNENDLSRKSKKAQHSKNI